MKYYIFKRIIDLIFAIGVLILISPFLFLIILLLSLTNQEAGIFFFQNRVGKNAKLFRIWKFKTMTDKRNEKGELLPDNERITKIGKFVRTTSIDELPQLFNVIKGEMSIIGPRPLLEKYNSLYSKEQFRRHEVKPGITGLAQVSGRNNISWNEKFKLDVYYVDNYNFWLDFKIIYLTFKKVLLQADINKEGHATTQAFNGKN
jgi:undecaprenyl phosphate N,N'-diacetylbacillosamine 1-phosphate transferase